MPIFPLQSNTGMVLGDVTIMDNLTAIVLSVW